MLPAFFFFPFPAGSPDEGPAKPDRRSPAEFAADSLRWLSENGRVLMIVGAVFVTAIVAARMFRFGYASAETPLWQLLLAGAAFLYLWRLGVLLFDLVFVWHYYVRSSLVAQRLYALRRARKILQSDLGEQEGHAFSPATDS